MKILNRKKKSKCKWIYICIYASLNAKATNIERVLLERERENIALHERWMIEK